VRGSPLIVVALLVGGLVLLQGIPAARVPQHAGGGTVRSRARPGRLGLVLGGMLGAVVAALLATVVAGLPVGPGAWLAAGLAAGVALRERVRGRRRRDLERARDRLDESVVLLAAELSAGRPPAQALQAGADAAPDEFAEAAQVAALGGDPAPALRRAAGLPGRAAAADVAAAWQVAGRTGAPVAAIMQRIRLGLQADLAAVREADEQVAPVYATARVLAVLPLGGLALGWALGVDSVRLLVSTGWGQACLLSAVGLVGAGLAWVEAITGRAAR
jgi:tight adherence protein B